MSTNTNLSSIPRTSRTSGIIGMLFVVLIWGSAYPVSKFAVGEVSPSVVAFLRNFVAAVILFPFFLYNRKKNRNIPLPPTGKILLLALTGVTLFYAFFNYGLAYTGAATAAFILALMPVMIAVPGAYFFKERLSKKVIAGIIISISGAVLLGFVGGFNEHNSVFGNTLVVLSVACWAAYTLLCKTVADHHPVVITFMVQSIGSLLLLPFVFIDIWKAGSWPVISTNAWLAILYLAVFSSIISYILYARALQSLTATETGTFLNLDPMIGAALSIIFLHEPFSTIQIAGAALIITGVWLSTRKSKLQ